MVALHDFQPIKGKDAEALPPLVEATIVSTTFITGGAVCVGSTDVRLMGWETIPAVEGGEGERRLVTRIVMSTDTAREIVQILRNALTKGGH